MKNKIEESSLPHEDTPKKSKKNQLISAMQPVFILENWYGIFRFHNTDDGLVPTKKKMKFISLVVVSAYVILFTVFLKLPTITGTGKLVDAMDEVPSIVILTQYFLSALRTSFLLSNDNIRLFKSFADLDVKLHIDTNQDFYKKSRKVTVRFLIIIIVEHVAVSISELLTENNVIPMNKIVVLPVYLEQTLELSVFCLMIWMLTHRLSLINNYLSKFIEEKDNKHILFLVTDKKTKPEDFNIIGRSSPDNMKIRDLAVAYDIIGDICGLINDIFNFQIFMSLVATFTYIVITIWTSIYIYRTPGQNDDYDSLVTIIVWCVTAILVVGFMSLICERLLVTRNDTKILVNKLIMDYELPKNMRVQAKAFMDLIEAWPLKIFIYDMFTVDISLMLKFISVATTYLIVIIQITHFL